MPDHHCRTIGFALFAALFIAGLLPVHPAVARTSAETSLPSPVTPACVSSPFGPRILPNHPLVGTFHNGIDLPAPDGAPVKAIAPGEVMRVQHHGPGGLEILIQHPGFVGIYSHLGMVSPAIAEGKQSISAGEQIGVVGHTGLTYGMHLFFGMLRDGHAVDPAPYLNVNPCAGAPHRTEPLNVAGDGIAGDGATHDTVTIMGRVYVLLDRDQPFAVSVRPIGLPGLSRNNRRNRIRKGPTR